METDIVLCLLIGIPGAGKSTLAKLLVSQKCEKNDINIIQISFDDFISLEEQKLLALDTKANSKRTSFKNVRINFLDILIDIVSSIREFNINERAKPFLKDFVLKRNDRYVFVIEDNFYYRSMRYKYYQFAREYKCGFCQIYLHCDIDLALERNGLRLFKVPDSVIEVMSKRLEVPSSELPWESPNLVLQSIICLESYLADIWYLFRECFHNAPATIEDRSEDIAAAQLLCMESLLHRADLQLRSLIAVKMKQIQKNNLNKGEERNLKEVALTVNNIRKNILMKLKTRSLKVPDNVWGNKIIDEKNLEVFLESEFEKCFLL